jgi:hypothetical protein
MGAKVLFLNEFQRIINISLFSDHNVNFPIRFFYSVYFSKHTGRSVPICSFINLNKLPLFSDNIHFKKTDA